MPLPFKLRNLADDIGGTYTFSSTSIGNTNDNPDQVIAQSKATLSKDYNKVYIIID